MSEEEKEEEDRDIVEFHREDSPKGDNNKDQAWKSYNLLSLDGGGIRGYWSLLVLQQLMEFIAIEEDKEDEDENQDEEGEGEGENAEVEVFTKVHHSFCPQPWPDNVSQVPLSAELRKKISEIKHPEDRIRALPAAQRYLPCHYFDYVCGSSTGALIAIMLGRFRMTVPDCMLEYETLAAKVFGRPRIFIALRFGLVDRTKYKAADLKKVFENVTERRSEPTSSGQRRIPFPSKRGLCKTFVTSEKRESDQPALQTLYLIRSYDHFERTSAGRSQRTGTGLSGLSLPRRPTGASTIASNRSNTGMSNTSGVKNPPRRATGASNIISNRSNTGISSSSARRNPQRKQLVRNINYGKAQDFEIWEVARAATAAPFFFDALKIKIPGSREHMSLTDAGLGHTNNPTKEGTNEIEWAYGTESIGIVVSVGTAKRNEGDLKRGPLAFKTQLKEIAQKATDTERVHTDMMTTSSKDGFPYFRLNDPDGLLKMEMDEWEPKPSRFNGGGSGSKTLERIRIAFVHWLSSDENRNIIQQCAEELVRCRRARSANRAKWERYATGAEYICRITGCERENFDSCVQFEQHLDRDHRMKKKDLEKELIDCRRDWQYQPAPSPA